jgi:hypothetical protein
MRGAMMWEGKLLRGRSGGLVGDEDGLCGEHGALRVSGVSRACERRAMGLREAGTESA